MILSLAIITHLISNHIFPPDVKKMDKIFQMGYKELKTLKNYLCPFDYCFIESKKNNKKYIINAYNTKKEVTNQRAVASLDKIFNELNFKYVTKYNNTTCFVKWEWGERRLGIAYVINDIETPIIDFLIELQPLSEQGWYYFEADYNKWRIINS